MVTPIASARPPALGRLLFPRPEDAASRGSPALLRRALESFGAPSGLPELSDLADRADRPPSLQSLDRFEASGYGLRFSQVRIQLSLERTIYDHAGRALQHESLDVTYERTELLVLRYGEQAGGTDEAEGETAEPAPPGRPNPLQALLDYTSPENTANRILNFVSAGFLGGRFSGGSGDDARAAFRDFILPVIEGASGDVVEALGDLLPDEGRNRVARTIDLVREGLDRFANGGDAVATPDD